MDPEIALRRAAQLSAACLSTSLRQVEHRVVVPHLNPDSPVRQLFERVQSKLDDLLEMLDDDRPAGGFTASTAAEPSEAAAEPSEAAAAEPDPEPPAPSAEQTEPSESASDESEQIEALTDELLEQEETETFAGELAEDAELRRVQAELKAKTLVEEQVEGRDED